jgi:hypothetical protein
MIARLAGEGASFLTPNVRTLIPRMTAPKNLKARGPSFATENPNRGIKKSGMIKKPRPKINDNIAFTIKIYFTLIFINLNLLM